MKLDNTFCPYKKLKFQEQDDNTLIQFTFPWSKYTEKTYQAKLNNTAAVIGVTSNVTDTVVLVVKLSVSLFKQNTNT